MASPVVVRLSEHALTHLAEFAGKAANKQDLPKQCKDLIASKSFDQLFTQLLSVSEAVLAKDEKGNGVTICVIFLKRC